MEWLNSLTALELAAILAILGISVFFLAWLEWDMKRTKKWQDRMDGKGEKHD